MNEVAGRKRRLYGLYSSKHMGTAQASKSMDRSLVRKLGRWAPNSSMNERYEGLALLDPPLGEAWATFKWPV